MTLEKEAFQNIAQQALEELNIYPDVASIQFEDDLFNLGALDSLTLIQFVLSLEDALEVRFNNNDITYENFKSYQDIFQLLQAEYLEQIGSNNKVG